MGMVHYPNGITALETYRNRYISVNKTALESSTDPIICQKTCFMSTSLRQGAFQIMSPYRRDHYNPPWISTGLASVLRSYPGISPIAVWLQSTSEEENEIHRYQQS